MKNNASLLSDISLNILWNRLNIFIMIRTFYIPTYIYVS